MNELYSRLKTLKGQAERERCSGQEEESGSSESSLEVLMLTKKGETREEYLDDIAEKFWGKSRTQCWIEEICVCCHKPVKLKDKEYWLCCLCKICRRD